MHGLALQCLSGCASAPLPSPFCSSLVQQIERAHGMASLVCAFWVGHLLNQGLAGLRSRSVSPEEADHDASLLLSIAAVSSAFGACGLCQLPCSSVNNLWLIRDHAWPIWHKHPRICQSSARVQRAQLNHLCGSLASHCRGPRNCLFGEHRMPA